MTKEQLFDAFKILFPNFVEGVKSYRKIGSKTIAIEFKEGKSRVFLFVDNDNWHFGTKLWRKRPDVLTKKYAKKKMNKEILDTVDVPEE